MTEKVVHTVTCDRCGETRGIGELGVGFVEVVVGPYRTRLLGDTTPYPNGGTVKHLCENCHVQFSRWLAAKLIATKQISD
jgi:hypothetical protein